MSQAADAYAAGWFGKIPSKADFVMRRLPSTFVSCWDLWLKGGLAASREQLGSRWLDHYLASPVWRFALSAGVCGSGAWVGVMIPSVDSAGRYFPMTLGRPLPATVSDALRYTLAEDWYEQAQALVLSTLADSFDHDAFDASVASLPADRASPARADGLPSNMVCFEAQLPQAPAALATVADRASEPYSLWWTCGGDDFAPATLIGWPLPAERGFACMLSADWRQGGQISNSRQTGLET